MKNISGTALELLNKGESFAQATILTSSGSTPRGAGSCMIIRKDGSIYGTVGGGVLEAHIIKTAGEVISEKRAAIAEITLDGKGVAQGAICGGSASVFVDYISPEVKGCSEFYRALAEVSRGSLRAKLVTAVPRDGDSPHRKQCLLLSDGSLAGCEGFEPAVQLVLKAGYDAVAQLESHRVCFHDIGADGTAYIFGAGHCGEKLVPVLSSVGFRTVVIDDRAAFANSERFPGADEILVPDSLDKPFSEIEFRDDSYVIIVTRGHVYDEMVLRAALRSGAGYIGMIGSKRKRETIYRNMLADGYTRSEIDRVYSPVGLEIGADTPEEIAVSIAAELIKVRSERRLGLRDLQTD